MTTYSPYRIPLETSLDKEGVRLGLARLPGESAEQYSLRLKAESIERSNGTVVNATGSLSRLVGGLSKGAIQITLRTAEGVQVANAPAIDVKAGKILFYNNYPEEVELEIPTRTPGETLFVTELIDLINESSSFEATLIEDECEWLEIKNLRLGNNIKTKTILAFKAQENLDLGVTNVLSLRARNTSQLTDLMETPEEVEQRGQYYLNSLVGVLTTYEGVLGEIEADYAEFPFVMFWDSISAYELFDPTTELFLQEEAVLENSQQTGYRLLAPEGNKIHRKLLQRAGNQWS